MWGLWEFSELYFSLRLNLCLHLPWDRPDLISLQIICFWSCLAHNTFTLTPTLFVYFIFVDLFNKDFFKAFKSICSLNLYSRTMKWSQLLLPFYRWAKWGSQRLNDSPKVKMSWGERNWDKSQVSWFPNQYLTTTLPLWAHLHCPLDSRRSCTGDNR